MPSATNVRVFPLVRRWSLVAETVDLLQRKKGDAATRFWWLTCRRLECELLAIGQSEEVIDRELIEFAALVSDVLREGCSLWNGGDVA